MLGDGCPVSPPITKNTTAVELELLELHEDEELEGLQRKGVSAIKLWKKVSEEKYPLTKDCAKEFKLSQYL